MKVLIGTPIHQVKDYAMERWLANVASLTHQTPADFLMVDNSPGLDYVEKVKSYCGKYGIKNYRIKHLRLPAEQGKHERVTRSWEAIRKEVVASDYGAWFSWECDQIIPPDTLDKLAGLMEAGNYTMIHPNSWMRELPNETNPNFGCSLIRRDCLEKYSFLDIPSSIKNTDNPWDSAEIRFKSRVLKDGGNYIELYGLIGPIYHLNE